jgi:uncharacterized membrane protein YraQ (UPF0718 family)
MYTQIDSLANTANNILLQTSENIVKMSKVDLIGKWIVVILAGLLTLLIAAAIGYFVFLGIKEIVYTIQDRIYHKKSKKWVAHFKSNSDKYSLLKERKSFRKYEIYDWVAESGVPKEYVSGVTDIIWKEYKY